MRYNKEDGDFILSIEYTHTAGEEMVHTESNGDPGTPGYPTVVEITAIYTAARDENDNEVMIDILSIANLLSDEFDDCSSLENEILEYHDR